MSNFKDMVNEDNKNVFINLSEFAESRTIKYDGEVYKDVSLVLTKTKEKDRKQLVSDHAEGLFLVTAVLHCPIEALRGVRPEKGKTLGITDPVDVDFFHDYYIATSSEELGMLRLELEAIDE